MSDQTTERLAKMTRAAYERFRQKGLARGWMPCPAFEELPLMLQEDWRDIVSAAQWAGELCKAASDETMQMRSAIDALCSARDIIQVDGPPMAYFECKLADGMLHRYGYFTYALVDTNGPGCDRALPICASGSELREAVLALLKDDLKSGKPLAWRRRPEVTARDDGLFQARFRLIQLEDAAHLDRIIYQSDLPGTNLNALDSLPFRVRPVAMHSALEAFHHLLAGHWRALQIMFFACFSETTLP